MTHYLSPDMMYPRRLNIKYTLIILLLALCVTRVWLYHEDTPLRTTVGVEMTTSYAVGDQLFFAGVEGDRLLGIDYCPDSSKVRYAALGTVVSSDGKVQAVLPAQRGADSVIASGKLRMLLKKTLVTLRERQESLRAQCRQMDYYAKTHTAIDEGYNEVMSLREGLIIKSLRMDTLVGRVEALVAKDSVVAKQVNRYYINGAEANYIGADTVSCTSRDMVYLSPRVNMVQHFGLNYRRGCGDNHLPSRLILDGDSLPCTISTRLAGVLESCFPEPTSIKFDTLGNIFRYTPRDSLYYADITYADGSHYRGTVDDSMLPVGRGLRTDAIGHIYCGEWQGGVLAGTGFAIDDRFVKSGAWSKGNFLGERMLYTTDRIYGIDISRYQHEIGSKRYAIDWRDLRIQHLGRASRKRIQGNVDYPVSFVFIKATEGTSIKNKYYHKDLQDARRAGIPVAAYHFFTMKAGKPQADFFLRNANLAANTLPPMLDVEPTDKEIKRMGGEQVLFREMLAWLKQVERACHRRPILYISQNFVNHHMPNAPAELRNYEVWIARYGEYKPYVHLLFWQLAYDGRVKGIHGEVDINVYNGTKESFDQWIESVR